MITFWLLGAAMIAAALVIVAPALLRRRELVVLDRGGQNVQIAQERLQELETDLQNGVLTQPQFDQARLELEQALLIDIDQPAEVAASPGAAYHGKFAFILLAVAVPLLTLVLYQSIGAPQLIGLDPQRMAHAAGEGKAMGSLEEMVKGLADRLKENPNDAEGWFMLGRSMMAMERYGEAVTAYETAYKLVGDEPEVMLPLADALTMANKGDAGGRAKALVQKVLAIQPDNPTGLWLGGIIAASEGRHQEALDMWNMLRPMLDEEPEEQRELDKFIDEARSKLGMAPATAAPAAPPAMPQATAGGPSIKVRVSLAPEMAAKVKPETPVFIYAKAVQGPKFPLAASRHQVKDLPLEITLDDSSAMMPQAKLSGFAEVTVGARVSLSGEPTAKSGDLMGEVSPVAVAGNPGVDVVIGSVVP